MATRRSFLSALALLGLAPKAVNATPRGFPPYGPFTFRDMPEEYQVQTERWTTFTDGTPIREFTRHGCFFKDPEYQSGDGTGYPGHRLLILPRCLKSEKPRDTLIAEVLAAVRGVVAPGTAVGVLYVDEGTEHRIGALPLDQLKRMELTCCIHPQRTGTVE